VYRQFKDAEEFIEELRKLKEEQDQKLRGTSKEKERKKTETLPLFEKK
jgi:hypothetical protein